MVKNFVIRRVAIGICCALTAGTVSAQVIERVSVDSGENQATGPSWVPASTRVVSSDGRYVVFSSDASDLVADDGNGLSDVFLRDRLLGTTVRISVNGDDGGDANGASDNPSISADGRYIAFASTADDLLDGDANGLEDVYVYDRVADDMVRASVDTGGGDPNGGSHDPYLDGNGRHVVFTSTATDLVAEGANTNTDIYVRDLVLGTTIKVSYRPGGVATENNSWNPAISADGRHVAFTSGDQGLVPGDVNGPQDVFVRDLDTGAIERVSVSTAGDEADGRNGVAVLSADGGVVAWWSRATTLVSGDDNGQDDIFVRDRAAGTTTRVNVSTAGDQADGGGSWHVTMTDDGRFVVFLCDASNLANGDVNGTGDVFSHDRLTGITRMHSRTPAGPGGNDYSRCPSVSPDGRYIAFESMASDFVDDDDNLQQDVFLAWGPATVMEDGFETGDCAGWSAEVGACDPNGSYASSPTVSYTCYNSFVSIVISQWQFLEHGALITANSNPSLELAGSATTCSGGSFSNTLTIPGGCAQTFELDGSFTDQNTWEGTFSISFDGSCLDCTNQSLAVTGTRMP